MGSPRSAPSRMRASGRRSIAWMASSCALSDQGAAAGFPATTGPAATAGAAPDSEGGSGEAPAANATAAPCLMAWTSALAALLVSAPASEAAASAAAAAAAAEGERESAEATDAAELSARVRSRLHCSLCRFRQSAP